MTDISNLIPFVPIICFTLMEIGAVCILFGMALIIKGESCKKKEDNAVILVNKIFLRELNMECLRCGKSLTSQILNKEIKLHFCPDCRLKFIKEDNLEAIGERKMKFKTKRGKLWNDVVMRGRQ